MSDHVHKWLDGLTGIEIGASVWNPYGLANCLNVSNDGDPNSVYNQEARKRGLTPRPIDRFDNGETLATFPNASLDYIFTSHVFEHFANPLGALAAWCRVLRPGGLIYMIVPQRDALPADAGRPLTTRQHLIDDLEAGVTLDTHPIPDGHTRGGHYHVFTAQSLESIIRSTCPHLDFIDSLDPDDQAGNGFALVFRFLGYDTKMTLCYMASH